MSCVIVTSSMAEKSMNPCGLFSTVTDTGLCINAVPGHLMTGACSIAEVYCTLLDLGKGPPIGLTLSYRIHHEIKLDS